MYVYVFVQLYVCICNTGTYILCLIVPRKYVAKVVFLWAMGYMTLSHIYRMHGDLFLAGIFDFTGIIMCLYMYTSLMYTYKLRNKCIHTCICIRTHHRHTNGSYHETDIICIQFT